MNRRIISGYRDNNDLRHSFNELTQTVYGFDFERWYQSGYWTDAYNPYSFVIDGKIVSNVSVNRMNLLIDGERKTAIQIGTVMTDPIFRKQGLNRILMEKVIDEYSDKCDFFYLFANDSVLAFYPKFGYIKANEYQHSGIFSRTHSLSSRKLNIDNPADRKLLSQFVSERIFNAKIVMLGNDGLIMFYLTSFMKNNIYYIEDLNVVAVAEFEDNTLRVQDVFSDHPYDLRKIIDALMNQNQMHVKLGFTPLDSIGFDVNPLEEENTTLFLTGNYPLENMMFPTLSHA